MTRTEARHGKPLASVPMSKLTAGPHVSAIPWLWHGLIARHIVTLITSPPKTGKTTLFTGLMQQLAAGGTFLDRPVQPARVLYVSEEPDINWEDRLGRMPLGDHCELMAEPFVTQPTPEEFEDLVQYAMEMQAAGKLDLLVIDSLFEFLPGATDSDAIALRRMIRPLKCLTRAGAAVVIMQHPRREPSAEGHSARGHGSLLASVDIQVELSKYGRLRSDARRRKLIALSRFPETPESLVYEWDPNTSRFTFLGDPLSVRFRENWARVLAILQKRKRAATALELLDDWPADLDCPATTTMYEWLNRAYEEKRVRRIGAGRRKDPFRFRLENEDDAYLDRGELPPVRRLDPREVIG